MNSSCVYKWALALGTLMVLSVAPGFGQGSGVTTMNTSYYTNRLNGHITSSRERFNNNLLTAAHKTLPLGTRLRLRNPKNGRTVVVRVNDRGPNVAGRELSITRRAAQRLGFLRAGVTQLEVTNLGRAGGRRVRHRRS
jgi:rare lipoprotein A